MELRDHGGAARAPELPSATRRLMTALAEGRAGRAFPPVAVPGPDGTLAVERPLGGPAEARALGHALADARFAPLHEVLRRIDAWSERAVADGRMIDPQVLRPENADLFGPLLTETLETCVDRPPDRAAAFADRRAGQFLDFLTLFLDRLARDRPSERRVTGLWANGEETHNGGQRVLRVEFADGVRLAYKPRPATGELLFLAAEDSVFALLNALPPAAGPVRLPTMRTSAGSGPDRACYSWQEWIEPPDAWGVLRTDGGWSLRGAVLDPGAAARYWHRAGSLAAAAFAFGITDLIGGNVLIGQRPGDGEPLLFPVDLEAYFADPKRLFETGLLFDPAVSAHHHVGLENVARWCDLDGPATCWRPQPDGSLRLERRTLPLARTGTRTMVGDTEGRTGYGPHLPAMLRGMFDAWTLMCRHRARIAEFLAERAAGHVVRVIARPTAEYPGGGDVPFTEGESEQLTRGDVPYFFRAADGGPLLALRMPPGRELCADPTDAPHDEGRPWPPVATVREGGKLDLAGLGIALRDAVEHVYGDPEPRRGGLHDHGRGVRIGLRGPREGEVSFDWPTAGRRITYRWDETKLRLCIDPLNDPAAREAAGIRERLLRLGRIDAALRDPWAAGGFTDTGLEAKLDRLTGTGVVWLRGVVAEHGWPGRGLVGEEAATAASALLQHCTGDLEFRRECLALIEAAAERGDMPRRDAAYLTDSLRRAEGRPQLYGTKFERAAGGDLRPCPIEDEERVDERRAAVGLGPLADYAALLAAKYPAPENEGVEA
ncbi:DUF4135 domain-containing protein [Kitasatospora griseola]|uniref:DUF4135 domain-containing protein n=1 Tax=Kitasatospora griseola TaxID=2064 RepID=UPI00166F82F3|nr:DUF4135 domain-containing protein [Kitasatospora griseola]GGQ78993.1 hypothetical protein GCM10010195_38430 [Kitasatospora griseola]